jgi:hypothetical protein
MVDKSSLNSLTRDNEPPDRGAAPERPREVARPPAYETPAAQGGSRPKPAPEDLARSVRDRKRP